ncbi:MAG: molybdopterin molybdenumtransferase MoeA [Acidobacteria bacterium]|nr:molybdopterin molybdenumtransferase MoeA [Acidobacteriota bacterium]
MAVMKFQAARELVMERVRSSKLSLQTELIPLQDARTRVLAQAVSADRDLPPFPRSTRDGYAVRAADVSAIQARLRLMGQARAGVSFDGAVGAGDCVEIMTGAPLPAGANAVVMVEKTSAAGDHVLINMAVVVGENIVAQGSEARRGEALLTPGRRLGYAEIAMIAAVGLREISVYKPPTVAILPTGDEIVELDVAPGPFEIRNSNSYSLQAQTQAAGGIPVPLGIAEDREDRLREMIERGCEHDVLLLSGGVSAGKFDLVEPVLAQLGAEFYFDGVYIQPGRPLVFGRVGRTFIFGLPGNPLSTMVTFELFVRPALALLAGEMTAPLIFTRARMTRDLRRKAGLAGFLPAILEGNYYEPEVSPVEWKGSGDVVSLTRANCFLAIPEEVGELKAGEWVSVMMRH